MTGIVALTPTQMYIHTGTHTGQNISLLMNVTKTRKWSHVKSSVCQHAEGCMAQEIYSCLMTLERNI